MKSINALQDVPLGISISSDDIIEFHASRILLLVYVCGVVDKERGLPRIDGLTKLAKLDFFVRYPSFFKRAAVSENKEIGKVDETVESKMIRFHYGPWDERYYQLLPYLEGRGLVEIRRNPKSPKQYQFFLTSKGKLIAQDISILPEFEKLSDKMKEVKKVLAQKTGSQLKNLIYQLFAQEIKDKKLGEVIHQ